ncbi:MAG TPA: STAS domain-containing protein [bacterium]|nr:STAS domain-containing protein [Candidatus Omnitrophota bacterium]HOJ58998.1 STAS domain-containing protein [bacterium]HOL95878.1 STAS domain-containing protein [bacterium]HPO99905.1 STAS domain-containing protein [bacterium]HXK93739.1 STAS domain-containing protein [bacterium]
MNPEGLFIQERRDQECYVIKIIGDLIITNAKGLQRHLDKAIEEGAREITLDMSRIDYIDSFGIGVVVKTKSMVDEKKGRLKVIANPTLQNLFQKCHLDDYFDVRVKEETAPEDEDNDSGSLNSGGR